jgi:nucleosome binding factor SPN SPT16 subunit
MSYCNRDIGTTGRKCILVKDHAGSCSGPTPLMNLPYVALPNLSEVNIKHGERIEFGVLAFKFGIILKDYDARHFRSMTHVSEAIDMHIKRLKLDLEYDQICALKEIAYKYFNG